MKVFNRLWAVSLLLPAFLSSSPEAKARPQREVLPLQYAATASGSISLPGQEDDFTFTGTAGQRLYYDTLSLSNQNLITWLVAPSGTIVGVNGNVANEVAPFYLLEDGVYTLKISDSGDAVGNYRLRLLDAAAAPSAVPGATNSVTLNPSSRTELVQFNGTAGQRLNFQSLSASTNSATWTIFDPNNASISGQVPIDTDIGAIFLRATGKYVIAVQGSVEDGPAVSFGFKITDLSDAPVPQQGFGTAHTGSLGASESATFTYSGNAGTLFFYDALVAPGSADYNAMLLDSDSNVVMNVSGTSDSSVLLLPRSGTYTLLLQANAGGNYGFALVDLAATAKSITFGGTNSSTISTPFSTDIYKFQGTPGQKVFYDSQLSDSSQVNLGGMSPNVGVSYGLTDAHADFGAPSTLSLPGTYYYFVSGGQPDSNADYSFRLLDLAQAPALPLAMNTVITNSVDLGSQSVWYSFQGVAGQQVFLDGLSCSGIANWEVFGPNDSALGFTQLPGDMPLVLPSTGKYSLEIIGASQPTPFAYSFQALTVTPTTLPLTLGTMTSGTLTSPGQQTRYTFSGKAGQRLYFDPGTGEGTPISVQLRDPFGNAVWLNEGAFFESYPFTLNLDGTYTLVIGGSSDYQGPYSFRLLDLSQAPVTPLSFETIYSGTNLVGNINLFYSFTAHEGDRLFVDGLLSDLGVWTVYGPDNANILGGWYGQGSDFEFKATKSGTYFVVLESGGITNSFGYAFRVRNAALSTSALALNTVVSNTFADAGDEKQYTFTASLGQRLFYDGLASDLDNVSVNLLSPSGTSMWNGSSRSDFGPITVLDPGTYTLIEHNSADHSATNWFRLLDLSAQPVLTLGTPIIDTLSQGTAAHVYQFVSAGGQKLHFQSVSAASSTANWYLYDPNNRQLAAANIQGDLGDVYLPVSGTYVLVVAGNGASSDSLDFSVLATDVSVTSTASGFGTFAGTVPPNDSVTFTFTGQAGTHIYIDSLTNDAQAILTITPPSGVTLPALAPSGGDYYYPDPGLLILPESGTYTAQVTASQPSTGCGYAFSIINLDTDALPLTLGATTSGQLPAPYQSVVYSFTGHPGQRVYYDGMEGDNEAVHVSLWTPDGNSLFGAGQYYWWSINADSDYGPYTLTESGTYYVSIQSGVADPEHYTFRLLDLAQPPCVLTSLTATNGFFRTVPSGFLSVTGSYVNATLLGLDDPDWRASQTIAGTRRDATLAFYGTNWGSQASLGLSNGTTDTNWSGFSVQWDGTVQITNTNTHLYLVSADSSRMWVDANQDGTFDASELVNNSWGSYINPTLSGNSVALAPGTYNIRIQYVDGPEVPQCVLASDNGQSLEPYGAIAFSFNANAGNLMFDSTAQANLNDNWYHYRRDADYPIAGQSAMTSFESSTDQGGTNVVIIANYSASPVPYSFRVLQTASYTNAITMGVTVSNILSGGQEGNFTFTGTAGQRIYLDELNTSQNNTTVTLNSPDGVSTPISAYPDYYDFGPYTLTESGTYTLTYHNHLPATVPVYFRVLDTSVQPLLSLDTTNEVVAPLGTKASIFRINGLAHLRLFVDALSLNGSAGIWTLYDANNASLGATYFNDFAADNLALTDTYLLVLNNSITNSYDFSFRVVPWNHAPLLSAIPNLTISEMVPFSYTNVVTDVESDNQRLTFTLDPGAPAGASIDPVSGILSWTPTEAQGPGVYPVTVRVTDDGAPPLSATRTFNITVNEVNRAPSLTVPGNQTINELTGLSVSASATDPDIPTNTLAFSLLAPPTGMSIDPVTGAITWTPSEAQGPSTNTITVVATDTNTNAVNAQHLSVTNSFTVVVNEVNSAPVLPVQTNLNISELTTLSVTNTATDSDLPLNPLTYVLLQAPTNATIDANGIITWTPTEAQGPSTNIFTTVVTDTNMFAVNAKSLSATNTFTVVVNEVNSAPTLASQADRTINELTPLIVTNAASDTDIPANPLSYQLLNPPAGMTIDANGVITWTPGEAQGPSTNLIVTVATDTNLGAVNAQHLSVTNSFTVVVNEVNTPPILAGQPNVTINELTALTVTNTAADADIPANPLTYSLENPPAGASINANGIITWTPTEAQGPGVYVLKTIVTDSSPLAVNAQHLSATNSFTVTVNEVNSAPTLPVQTNYFVNELTLLSITNTATDLDIPVNPLSYQLINPPSGMTIDTNGIITWTPTEAQGPSTNVITAVVTDTNTNSLTLQHLSATNTFTVIVNEVNTAPTLPVQADRTINELTQVVITNAASDTDIPANPLSYQLLNPPTGMTIDANGVITWTPSEAQGPSTNLIVTVATDSSPAAVNAQHLSVTNSFTLVVNEVNSAPVLGALSNRTVSPGQTLSFTATATDTDIPANSLTFSLVTPPAGASITSNGQFTWRPTVSQAKTTNTVVVEVTDSNPFAVNAQHLTDTKSFTVIVNALTPVTLAPLGYSGTSFTMQVNGALGPDYTIQSSANLSTWTTLGTTNPVVMPFQFTDPNANGSRKFYRVFLGP